MRRVGGIQSALSLKRLELPLDILIVYSGHIRRSDNNVLRGSDVYISPKIQDK